MRLSEDNVKLFYKLNPALLLFVNLRLGLRKKVVNIKDFLSLKLEKKVEVRNALYDNIDLIDEFVEKNPENYSSKELDIVSSWKHFLKSTFYVFRHLKNYSVFLSSETEAKAYGVLGISSDLKEMFPHLPIMVDTVLMPFKQHVIYDGFMAPYSMTFGGGIIRNFKTSYDEAKAKFGIITNLPFEPEEKRPSDSDLLKFYLKNQRNREIYCEEIQDLIYDDPGLLAVYHQETGKSYSRSIKKRLREIGVKAAWFASLEGIIIANGKTKKEVETNLKQIVPADRLNHVYTFQFKGVGKKSSRL